MRVTTLLKPHLEQPVASTADLVAYLATGGRPQGNWGIGPEIEKLVVDAETGEAASFARIEALLTELEAAGGWQGEREDGRLIALRGAASSITLEPGGQLELSGELCADIHCCQGDLARHLRDIVARGAERGLCFLGLGVQPFTPLERIDWLPKARYAVMGPYMARTGDMGQRMMKQTAGLQVNLDFADEADAVDKLRLAMAMSPLLYALFANSPLLEGKPSGFLSTRGEIWSRTDPDRCGLIPALFREGAGLETYADYALDVPMYFIVRGGAFRDLTRERFTFRRFLAEGHAGERATLADWALHLSTLSPETRLRPHLEIRTPDSLPPALILSVSALLKGIFYDAAARAELWALFAGQSDAERDTLYRQSWRLGLGTPHGRRTLRETALDAIVLARDGLRRQGRRDSRGLDESVYLDGVEEIVESGVTLAERLLARWRGSRKEKVAILRDHCGFAR